MTVDTQRPNLSRWRDTQNARTPRMPLSSATEFDSLFEPLLDSDEAAQLLKIHPWKKTKNDHEHHSARCPAGAGDVRISRALKAGARGYLLKSLLRKELLDTIRAVHAGQKKIPADLATQVADHVADDTLTLREIEVLRAIAAGNANKLIADKLSITEETVKGHVKNIL
jgi:ATP/maltotriose-dependent transcriptional regulator MalT